MMKDLYYDAYMTQIKFWLKRQKDIEKSDRLEWLKEHNILEQYEIWSNKEIVEELKRKIPMAKTSILTQ